jgi:hypothetical protein
VYALLPQAEHVPRAVGALGCENSVRLRPSADDRRASLTWCHCPAASMCHMPFRRCHCASHSGVNVEYRSSGIDVMRPSGVDFVVLFIPFSMRSFVPFRRMYERAQRFLDCHMNDVTDAGTLTLFTTKVRCACPYRSRPPAPSTKYPSVCSSMPECLAVPVLALLVVVREHILAMASSRQHHVRAPSSTPAITAGSLGPAAVVSVGIRAS